MELKPLDIELQELAKNDWEKFVSMIGEDAVISAKICLLRKSGNSYGKISVKLQITYRQAEHGCKHCDIDA